MRFAALVLGVAVLVGGCAAPPPVPSSTSIGGFRVLLLTEGRGDGASAILSTAGGGVRQLPLGTPSPDGSRMYVISSDSAGQASLSVHDLKAAAVVRQKPISSPAFEPVGILSADGRWLVTRFVDATVTTHIAVFDTMTLAERDIVLAGDFGLDAIDTSGQLLYLLETAGPNQYRVRDFDLIRNRLDADVIVDKREASPVMSGTRVTSVARRDGQAVYSLYRRAGASPFVHVLWTGQKLAFCVDLPSSGALDAGSDWSLLLDESRSRLYVLNPRGVAAEIDATQNPQLLRTRSYQPPGAVGGRLPGVVLEAAAKGSYELPARGRAALSGDGSAIFIPDGSGYVTLATASLTPAGRSMSGRSLSGLVLAPGGKVLFAIETGPGKVIELDVASGREIASYSAHRPLAILGIAAA